MKKTISKIKIGKADVVWWAMHKLGVEVALYGLYRMYTNNKGWYSSRICTQSSIIHYGTWRVEALPLSSDQGIHRN